MKNSIFCALVTLVFVFLTIVSPYSIAVGEQETFTLRNNIRFGDSSETVKQKEPLTLDDVTDSEKKVNGELSLSSSNELTTLAGIDRSYVAYHFANDKLNTVTYNYRHDIKGERNAVMLVVINDYSNIETALDEKYGAALDEDDIYASIDTDIAAAFSELHATMQIVAFLNNKKSSGTELKVSERIVHEDDGAVKIDHVVFGVDDLFLHSLCYRYYTATEIDDILHSKKNSTSVTDDI